MSKIGNKKLKKGIFFSLLSLLLSFLFLSIIVLSFVVLGRNHFDPICFYLFFIYPPFTKTTGQKHGIAYSPLYLLTPPSFHWSKKDLGTNSIFLIKPDKRWSWEQSPMATPVRSWLSFGGFLWLLQATHGARHRNNRSRPSAEHSWSYGSGSANGSSMALWL